MHLLREEALERDASIVMSDVSDLVGMNLLKNFGLVLDFQVGIIHSIGPRMQTTYKIQSWARNF